MLELILRFSRCLRNAGLQVSLSEVLDCVEAVECLPLDEATFATTLQCCLVKDSADIAVFQKVYHLFFHTIPQIQKNSNGKLAMDQISLPRSKSHSGKGLGRSGSGGPAEDLVAAILQGNEQELDDMVARALEDLGPFRQEDLQGLEGLFRQIQVKMEWFMAVNQLEKLTRQREIEQDWQQRILSLESKIKEYLDQDLLQQFGKDAFEILLQSANSTVKNFSSLNSNEVGEIRRQLARIARRLSTRKSRRLKKSNRGIVDLRKTMGDSVLTGGLPIKLSYKKKIIDKPELVLLCDISGSVVQFSEFMLLLVYSMQQRFKRVRSFVFVDWLSEATEYFKEQNVEQALARMFSEARFTNSGFSDFGKVFRQFRDNYIDSITPKTTVIILGDARNNWQPPREEALEQITRKAAKTIWLNPQERSLWDSGDSIISNYGKYCHQVYCCANLNELKKVADQIF